MLKHFFKQLFCRSFIHGDPHDGNYRFRNTTHNDCVILYDYGCIQQIDRKQSLALLSLILHTQQQSDVDVLDLYAQAGFDRDKLTYIQDQLPAISETLFKPFLSNERFQCTEWNVSQSIQKILGEHAWWFRSAGPCNALLVIRSFSGLIKQIRALNAYVNWAELLEACCQNLFDDALALGNARSAHSTDMSFHSLAKHLNIQVKHDGIDHVSLNLPAQAILDLHHLIEPDVKSHILNKNIDLDAIITHARETGFRKQVLFALNYGNKELKVQLS